MIWRLLTVAWRTALRWLMPKRLWPWAIRRFRLCPVRVMHLTDWNDLDPDEPLRPDSTCFAARPVPYDYCGEYQSAIEHPAFQAECERAAGEAFDRRWEGEARNG